MGHDLPDLPVYLHNLTSHTIPTLPFRIRGEPVALKLADSFNSGDLVLGLKREDLAYNDLAPLQGACIPRLVGFGSALRGLAFFLATSLISGQTLDKSGCASSAHFKNALKVSVLCPRSDELYW